ncbi:hypothetical protein [Streptomyces sp. NRRL S-118]|uniref:hypothetical protein n=1 Tax=Streptomyces sp. NRRL S-118 TaxID=1463881 RepID=UPI00131E1831|nr:hypothetical protein [Streptomyces sp. NRRL S-118]
MLEDARLGGVMHASFGVHADEAAAPCISLLTLSDIDTGAPTPALAVAQCGLRMAGPALGEVQAARFLTLPCERPAALTTCLLPAPPQRVSDVAGLLPAGAVVFQARVAIARPQGSRVVITDLTTTAVPMADEYTEIALGVAGTVSFVDPDPRPQADVRPSRLLEALL